jgi:beta-xylosidase
MTEKGKDMAGTVANASLLVQKAPTGSYEITTYIAFSPTQDFQQAGLVMYGNGLDFCKLVYVYNDQDHNRGKSAGVRLNTPGNPTSLIHITPRTSGYFLQLDVQVGKKGATYTGYASPDGTKWQPVRPSYPPSTIIPAYIGLYAATGNGSTAPPIPADFDFFQERPLPAGVSGPLPVAKF